jgi:UDP-glucuronate 4-epimerase
VIWQSMSKQTILVTGAAGFIGFHTSLKLLELGYKVVGIDNLNDYYDVKMKKERLKILSKFSPEGGSNMLGTGLVRRGPSNFTFLKLDISNKKVLFSKIKKYKFSNIIHLAGQAGVRYSIENPYAYLEANYLGSMNIFELAKEYKIERVLYASSSSVYGDNEKQPFEEVDKTDTPISVYAATKKGVEVLAHVYAKLFGIKMIGLRFFTVYGSWYRPDMAIFTFTKSILQGNTINVYNHGKMSRSFTHVDDIVSGILGALNSNKSYAVYNLGGGEKVELMHLISLIEKNLNKKANINFLGMQPGDVKETVASTRLSEQEIGYKAKGDIENGIKQFVGWFLENQKWLLKLKKGKQ